MSFWDTSALLPLILEEPGSAAALRLLRAEGPPVVWWGSLVECTSALERRLRAGQLKIGGKRAAECPPETSATASLLWRRTNP